MEKISVCAYCRVSTNKNDQANSYENQQTYFEREISKNENYELYKIYADKGISATSYKKRDEFLQMVYDAGIDIDKVKYKEVFTQSDREPKFKRILVKDSTRFARNILAVDVLRELRANGVSVDFLDIGKSSENIDEETLISIFMLFGQSESSDRSKKVRFGKQENARKGVVNITNKMYGYDYDLLTKEVTINEEQGEIVKKIFDLYVNHDMGDRTIANYLNDNGIPAPLTDTWNGTTIGTILKNEKYFGRSIRNRLTYGDDVFTKSSTYFERPEDEWIVIDNALPAIIDEETYIKAQEIRQSKTRKYQGKSRGLNLKGNEFAGKIICGNCNGNYNRNTFQNKPSPPKIFYNCATKKKKGIHVCDNPNIQDDVIEKYLEELQKNGIQEMINIAKKSHVTMLNQIRRDIEKKIATGNDDEEVQRIKAKHEQLVNKKKDLLDLFLDKLFTKEELNEKVDEINLELERVEIDLKKINASEGELKAKLKEIDNALDLIEQSKFKKEYSRQEIIDMISKIVIKRNKETGDVEAGFYYTIFDTINKFTEHIYSETY